MSTTATMTQAAEKLMRAQKATRLLDIININNDANQHLAQVIRQTLAHRNARPRARRTFRDKFFEIRKRRGVPTINLDALAACPPGNRHEPPVELEQGPSPTIESLPPKIMERRVPMYKDMTAITKYDSEQDIQIKYYIQLRDYYSSLRVEQPSFVPAHVWSNYVARKPVPAVDSVTVQGWVNYAPCPVPAKRAHDESDGYSRQPAKRARHSFSASAAPCNQ